MKIKISGPRGKKAFSLPSASVPSKYFAVTPWAGTRKHPHRRKTLFSVTHIPSGFAIVQRVKRDTAERIAEAAIKVPLPWQSSSKDAIIAEFKKLPLKHKRTIWNLQQGIL